MVLNTHLDALMQPIPQGIIIMRDDRKKETWKANIQAFWLSKYPVTQALYREVIQSSPSHFTGSQKPIECVSWLESIQFCNQLSAHLNLSPYYEFDNKLERISADLDSNGFRLPSEAEWQYACQAGSKEIRYGDLDQIAWYKANSMGTTHEVGKKAPNKWGLHDMLGNVWEWCSDIYDEEVYGSYRVFRGGGWFDEARSVMATNRRRSHPVAMKIEDLGFRLARNMDNM
ncbi:MAG: formylglycine-generating enzyme family protein [Bacteroidia bacterium]